VSIGLALLASLFWGGADFAGGLATRTVPLRRVLAISQVAGLASLVVLVAARGQPLPSGSHLLYAAGAGAASIVSLACIYYATAIGPIIVVAPVAALGAALPITAGLLHGASLGLAGAVGLACALCGVTIAGAQSGSGGGGSSSGGGGSGGGGSGGGRTRRHGARRLLAPALALGSAGAAGSFLLLLNQASGDDPYGAATAARCCSCALALGYLAIRRLRPVVTSLVVTRPARARTARDHARDRAAPARWPGTAMLAVIVAAGLGDAGAEASFAAASSGGDLTVIAVLASLYPVVTVLLAVLVLRDRVRWVQACGAVITVAGAMLLAGASP
jgi:drug/metabolite transporter (DMT)-like permease